MKNRENMEIRLSQDRVGKNQESNKEIFGITDNWEIGENNEGKEYERFRGSSVK